MLGCSHFFSKAKRLACTSIPLGFQKSVSVCSVLLAAAFAPLPALSISPAMQSFHSVHNVLSVAPVVFFLFFVLWLMQIFCLQMTKSLILCIVFYTYIPEF